MTDEFQDIDINNSTDTLKTHSSLGYLYKKNRSNAALLNNNSYDHIPKKTSPLKSPVRSETAAASANNNHAQPRSSYSPSKKLKKLRGLSKEDLKQFTSIDNSDDELDDSTIIFDVPLSQSLVQLTNHQKLNQSKLLSINSTSTRNSSLMSANNNNMADINSDYELDIMSIDAKRITLEFSQSPTILSTQESDLRRHILSQLERPKSCDDSLLSSTPSSDLKNKYLTSTRPNHLPPKSKRESLKHLKEVEQLKSNAIKQEISHQKATIQNYKNLQKLKSQDYIIWEREIIPDFNNKLQLSSTRELWWRGIPQTFRKFTWCELIQCKSISKESLTKLHTKALKSIKENTKLVQIIEKDLLNVFPDLGLFQKGCELHDSILIVILMYSHLHPYTLSISSLSALLLYNIKSIDDSFCTLIGLLSRNLMKSIHMKSNTEFHQETQSFLRTFAKRNPSLYHHFQSIKINPDAYLIPLLKPIFTNLLSMEVCSAIMDVYIFEGDSMLWRCVLGLFDKIGYKLFGTEEEILQIIGWDALKNLNRKTDDLWFKYLDVGTDVEFMNTVREVLKNK